ncbi:MAG TPA: acyl-CoA dehydrogenase family protein [Methylomirabilota bacterium]|jgi:alkylation response protein AidB-like acyl-CoA dehydrogenase|nr:acyl-CoA dehydrogenase family protein [Methylomirabilota bacterium]
MDFTLTPEQERFRAEVRAWLSANLPPDWATRPVTDTPRSELHELGRQWQRKLHDAGLLGLTWPREYGGRGLSWMEELILHEELVRHRAPPPLNVLGLGMAGPTIIAYGTEAQKRRYLRKILTAEEIWCQGYSEPNAGSDLASLQTRAIRDGDHYVVTGQKVWTSLAQIADWMMLLARTDPDAPRHRGITYLLLDMHAPGVTVRPLRQMTGDSEFNEVFLESVRVPVENVLGAENQGWQVGITTLMYERLALGFGLQARFEMALAATVDLARRTRRDGRPATQHPVLRQRLAQLAIDNAVFKYTAQRAITKLLRGEMPGAEASAGKIWWCERHQALQDLAQDLLGVYGQLGRGTPWAVDGGNWQYTFLRSRANSIEGGTTEIQRNILAERVLGLPKD